MAKQYRSTTPVYVPMGKDPAENLRVPHHVAKAAAYYAEQIVARQTINGVPPTLKMEKGALMSQIIAAGMKDTVERYGVKWQGWEPFKAGGQKAAKARQRH